MQIEYSYNDTVGFVSRSALIILDLVAQTEIKKIMFSMGTNSYNDTDRFVSRSALIILYLVAQTEVRKIMFSMGINMFS